MSIRGTLICVPRGKTSAGSEPSHGRRAGCIRSAPEAPAGAYSGPLVWACLSAGAKGPPGSWRRRSGGFQMMHYANKADEPDFLFLGLGT
jgi:hypothetical protein